MLPGSGIGRNCIQIMPAWPLDAHAFIKEMQQLASTGVITFDFLLSPRLPLAAHRS